MKAITEVLDQVVECYTGKRGKVEQTVLVLLDRESAGRLRNTFDYVMSEDEIKKQTGKLTGKKVRAGRHRHSTGLWRSAANARPDSLAVVMVGYGNARNSYIEPDWLAVLRHAHVQIGALAGTSSIVSLFCLAASRGG